MKAKACKFCPSGWSTSNKNSTRCNICKSGSFQKGEDFKTCVDCPKGYYQPAAGETLCTICDFNTYNSEVGSNSKDACLTCPKNEDGKLKITKRQGEVGIEACTEDPLLCDAGHRPVEGKCEKCMQGFHSNKQNTKCILCRTGLYQSEKGKGKCVPCKPQDDLCFAAPGATKPHLSSSSGDDDDNTKLLLFKPSINQSSPESIYRGIENTTAGNEDNGGSGGLNSDTALRYFEWMDEETRNTAIAVLVSIIILAIALHRLYPSWFKTADLMFAGDHYIADSVSSLCICIIVIYSTRMIGLTLIFNIFVFF